MSMPRETAEGKNPQGLEYRCDIAGADHLIVAMNPGNSGGAKGVNSSCERHGSTKDGRNS